MIFLRDGEEVGPLEPVRRSFFLDFPWLASLLGAAHDSLSHFTDRETEVPG